MSYRIPPKERMGLSCEQEVVGGTRGKGQWQLVQESSCLLSPSSLGKLIAPSGNHWWLSNWVFGYPTAYLTQVEDFVSGRDDSNPIAEVTEQPLILNLLTKTESNNKKASSIWILNMLRGRVGHPPIIFLNPGWLCSLGNRDFPLWTQLPSPESRKGAGLVEGWGGHRVLL